MDDVERLTSAPAAGIRSCWICGIRLPAERMVADGGSACADIRYYCRDMRACTLRWTRQPADPTDYPGATPAVAEPFHRPPLAPERLSSQDIPSRRW